MGKGVSSNESQARLTNAQKQRIIAQAQRRSEANKRTQSENK